MKIFKRLTACLICLTMLVAVIPAYASLEATTRHTKVAGWTIVSSFTDSDAYVDTSTYASGTGSLRFYNNTKRVNDDTYLRADTTAVVKEGKTYRLEFKAKSDKSKFAELMFDWTGFYSLTPVSDTYDWTTFKFLYTAAADATLNIRFHVGDVTNGFWIDDVKFYDVESGEGSNLLANGNFDSVSTANNATALGNEDIPKDMIVDVFPGTKTIDGKLDDWQNEEVHKLERVEPLMDDLGEMISADIRYSYDEENLYLGVEVTDSSHNTSYTSSYWNGDSFQWCQAHTSDIYVVSRGVAYYPEDDFIHQQTDDHQAMVTRNGNKTIYEIAMPWSVDFADNVDGVPSTIRFNAIVNNNNGDGRAYALEINEGITIAKNINFYLYLRMWEPLGDIAYRSDCVKTMNMGGDAVAQVYLANPTASAQSVQISAPGYNKTVNVAAGDEGQVDVPIMLTSVGENEFDITLTSNETSDVIENDVLVYHNEATYKEAKSKMEAYVAELKELLYQCENKGINAEYETGYYSILARQIQTMDMEASHGVYDRVHEYEKVFDAAVPEIKASLNSYLSGEKTPFVVPKFTTGSEIEFDGSTIYSEMDVNGAKEKRPMFFIGYGQMYGAAYLTPFFSNLGVNMIATDIEWKNVIKEVNASGWVTEARNGSISEAEVVKVDEETNDYAFKVSSTEASAGSNRYVRLKQTIAVEPGATYEFGVKVKGDAAKKNGENNIWMNPDGFAGTWMYFENSDDWKEYKGEHTVPAGDKEVDFSVFVSHNVAEVYLDNFYFRKKGTTENMVDNGDLQLAARPLSEIEQRMADKGWYVDRTSVDWIEKVLATAEENNVIVSVCLSPHHIPSFILADDPEATAATEHFMPGSPFNKTYHEAMELWFEYYYSILTKYDCVYDTVVVNEPKIFANNNNHRNYFNPFWWDYLTEKYGTIEALNDRYRDGYDKFTDYKAGANNEFENVIMPDSWIMEPTPLYYDYICFNDSLMEKFTEMVMGYAHKYAPQLKSSLKVMQYNHMNYTNYYKQGTNYELMSKLMDVNGCDSYSNYGMGNRTMASKMAWYDYMTEVDDSPIWDTEAHVLDDAQTISYDGLRPYYSSGEIWNGAVHKRSAAVMWWWELRDTMQPAPIDPGGEPNANSNVAYRPATAMANVKAMMDIQRLSREITALQDEEATVGLMYSRLNVPYGTDDYMQAYNDAYKEIIFSGQKVKHIYDSEPAKMQSCELLVVPEATNAKADMMENIKTFLDNGGKLLLVGDNCLLKDEYNKPHNQEIIDYIYNHTNTDKVSTVTDKIKAMALSEVVLIDTATGEQVENVEWSYTEYNGNILVNIMDYTEVEGHSVEVKIMYNGNQVSQYKELRDDLNLSGNLTLNAFQPVLIQFAK